MKHPKKPPINKAIDITSLFDRVVSILEQAKTNVARAVNANMTLAYWHIGREIVQELQKGRARAEYGDQVIDELSKILTSRFGKGFSETNLKYFRLFFLTYADRDPEIRHKPCDESALIQIRHKACDELPPKEKRSKAGGVLDDMGLAVKNTNAIRGFSSQLSWSHYRCLTKVENKNERLFYEIEAEKEGWSVPLLERQIHSFLFARLLKSRDKDGVIDLISKGQIVETPR